MAKPRAISMASTDAIIARGIAQRAEKQYAQARASARTLQEQNDLIDRLFNDVSSLGAIVARLLTGEVSRG